MIQSYPLNTFPGLFGGKGTITDAKQTKTRKAVAKRFKITGSGKIVRSRPGKRHLLASKNAKRRRKLGTSALVDKTDYSRVLENLPFSH